MKKTKEKTRANGSDSMSQMKHINYKYDMFHLRPQKSRKNRGFLRFLLPIKILKLETEWGGIDLQENHI